MDSTVAQDPGSVDVRATVAQRRQAGRYFAALLREIDDG